MFNHSPHSQFSCPNLKLLTLATSSLSPPPVPLLRSFSPSTSSRLYLSLYQCYLILMFNCSPHLFSCSSLKLLLPSVTSSLSSPLVPLLHPFSPSISSPLLPLSSPVLPNLCSSIPYLCFLVPVSSFSYSLSPLLYYLLLYLFFVPSHSPPPLPLSSLVLPNLYSTISYLCFLVSV